MVSKSQQRATNKYIKNNYDRINVTIPKGEKAKIQALAAQSGETLNGYIVKALMSRMMSDGQIQEIEGLPVMPKRGGKRALVVVGQPKRRNSLNPNIIGSVVEVTAADGKLDFTPRRKLKVYKHKRAMAERVR